jgi:oligosaccharide repeat unit polymerase
MKISPFELFLVLIMTIFVCWSLYIIESIKIITVLPFILIHVLVSVVAIKGLKIGFQLSDPIVNLYLNFATFISIGSIFIYANSNLLAHELTSNPKILTIALFKYMFSMTLSLVITILVSKIALVKETKKEVDSQLTSNNLFFQKLKKNADKYSLPIKAGFLLCLLVLFVKLLLQPAVLHMYAGLFTGDSTGRAIRILLTQESVSNDNYFGQGYFNFIIYKIFPLFIVYLYFISLLNKKKILALLIVSLGVLIMLLEFRRGPALHLCIAFFLTSYIFVNRIRIIKMLRTLFILIIFVSIVTVYLGRNTNIDLVTAMFYRLFISQSQTGSYIFQYLENGSELLYGKGYLSNLQGILPGVDKALSTQLYHSIHGDVGSASFSSYVEVFYNFYWTGLILYSCIIGLLLYTLRKKFIQAIKRQNPLEITFVILISSFVIPSLTNGSLIGTSLQYIGLYITVIFITIVANLPKILNFR